MSEKQNIQLGWGGLKMYQFTTPSVPKETEIAGYDLPKAEQHWRAICPKFPLFKYMTALDKEAFLYEQGVLMEDGFWFMDNGEPTYITGMHYQHLAVNRFAKAPNRGVLDYREQQRDNFYFKEIVYNDNKCYGDVTIKPRRIGASAERQTESMHIATRREEQHVGLMAQTREDAYELLYDPIAHLLRYRHPLLKPLFYAPKGTLPKGGLSFDNFRLDNEEMGIKVLGSSILVGSNTIKAFDGQKKNLIIMDECWKWGISPKRTLEIHKPVIKDNGKMIGKISMLSTMGDDDKVMEQAIKDGLEIWAESDPLERNKNEQTKSGLYKWFIPSQTSDGEFIDKYGKCNEEKALEKIHNERAQYEVGSPEYIGEVRRFPISEEEVLGTTSLKTTFNTMRINARLQSILALPIPSKPYIKGNLIENPLTGLVEFIKTVDGKWKIALGGLPHDKAKNRYNQHGSRKKPKKGGEFGIGVDPVSWARTTSGKVSKQAIMVLKKYRYNWENEDDQVVKNEFRICALYNSRESTPTETHTQALLACRFWGASATVERNVSNQLQLFETSDMFDFLQYSKYDDQVGFNTTKETTEDGIGILQELVFRKPKDGSTIDYLSTDEKDVGYEFAIPFEEILQQAKDFDIRNTRKFDVIMSFIMAVNSIEKLLPIRYKSGGDNMARAVLEELNNTYSYG